MKQITILFILLLCIFDKIYSQEFRGMDLRMEYLQEAPTSNAKIFHLDLYFDSTDSIEMDSFVLGCEWYTVLYFQEHQYLDNATQLLRFADTVNIFSTQGTICFNSDSLYLGDIVNLTPPDSIRILFASYVSHWPYNSDPIFHSLQSDMYIEEGIVNFNASAIDPNEENIGYYLRNNFQAGDLAEYYYIPDGVILDSLTGLFTWRPTSPGKYLFSIGYSESFDEIPTSDGVNVQRYMVFDIKEEDVVATSLDSEETSKLINIFPNPSTGIVNIEKKQTDKYDLKLFDVNGKILQERKSIESINYSLDLRALPKGLYLLHVVDGDKVNISKIIRS